MKSFRLFLYSGAFIILSFLAGCDSDYAGEEIYCGNLIVYNYINTGCSNKILSADIEDKTQEQKTETLSFKTIDNGTRLEIKHNNASYYRTGEILIEASIDDMDIFINEKEASISGNDVCKYSLTYEIPLSVFGKYTIKINDGKSYTLDYNLYTDVTIDIVAD